MTAEQKVKQKYPDAYLAGSYSMTQAADDFDVIRASTGRVIGSGHTPSKAYCNALARMEATHE